MKILSTFASALLLGVSTASMPMVTAAHAGVSISISINTAPPELPVYVQPAIPAPGYIWTPGYWAWSADFSDYYWVPGTWVAPPVVGYLWTPPYWGWDNGVYIFHDGYWGQHVGFYGGISYGFGYGGNGYEGGYWQGNNFYYNRSVNNITNVHITNVYERNVTENHVTVSYNGGSGGVQARPTQEQLLARNEHHIPATQMQLHHFAAAAGNRDLRASVNHGKPAIAATAHPGVLSGHGVTHSSGATHKSIVTHGASPTFAGSTHLHHTAPSGGAVGGPPHHTHAAGVHSPGTGLAKPPVHTIPPRKVVHAAPPRPVVHPPKPAPHAPGGPLHKPHH